MTLLINKDFVCQGIQVTISLPESYDSKKAYPVVFLNDGQLGYLGKIADSVILVGLEPQNRLDDFTPWQAKALRPGSPDFGGKLASYHDHLFGHIFKSIAQEFRLDESRMAYGGYSLGGLAAISSLYSSDRMPLIFSICGSFWYPDFVDYCKAHQLINKSCSVYLRNGLTEGAKHKNRLVKAPSYAKEVHELIKKQSVSTYSAFDPYGHHDHLQKRYDAFSDWLIEQWKL
ncbi:alpha/beta hydrolase-fold protein [Streptococcus salivarius]